MSPLPYVALRMETVCTLPAGLSTRGMPQTSHSAPNMTRDPRLIDETSERVPLPGQPSLTLADTLGSTQQLQASAGQPRKKSWLARTFSRRVRDRDGASSTASSPVAGRLPQAVKRQHTLAVGRASCATPEPAGGHTELKA